MAKGMSMKVLLQLQTKEFQKGIKSIQRQLNGLKNFMKSAFALGSVTMFGRELVQVGKDFENAMAKVQAVSNATQEEMRKMTAEAERLGKTTRYSATEAATALENLTRNGMTAAQSTKALSSVLQLAQANSIELAEAANIVTNTLNMFNLGVNQANRVNDVLSSTASHAATDITSLYEAMVNAAPAANVLGFSLEEVASAIGALAQRGVKGSEAGTKLRIAFQKMADPKVVDKMHDYGIEIDENSMKTEGLRKTVEKLAKANLSLGQLGKIFDAKSAMAIQMLTASLEDLDAMLDVTANSAGETERMFNQSVGSVQGELDSLRSMYEGLLITISKKTSGAVKTAIKALQNLIINFNTVGGTIMNIASVVVPLFASKIIQLGTTIRTAMTSAAAGVATLKTAMGGILSLVATLITWVGTALVGAWNRNNQAMKDANKQMGEAKQSAIEMQNAVEKMKEKIGDGSDEGSINSALKEAIRLFPDFADAINNAKKIAKKTGEWDKLKKVLQDIADLQSLVTMRDAKQAVANAQAQKIGQKMYNDATTWFGTSLNSINRNGAARTINRSLKSQGFTKEQIKEIFKQLASVYASKKDSYEGYKEVEKFLKNYNIEIDYGTLSTWLNKYNSDFNDLSGPGGTGGRRNLTGGLKRTNEDIRQADSTIAVNSYKILKDNLDNIEKNTREELGNVKKHQDEYNRRMYDAAQDFYDKVLDLNLNPEGELMKEAQAIVAKYPQPKEKPAPRGGSGGGSSKGGGSSTKVEKTDADYLKDVITDYNEAETKLANRLAAGTISTQDYVAELNKLKDKTWEAITAFSNFRDILDKLGYGDFGVGLESDYARNRTDEGAAKIASQLKDLAKYTAPSRQARDTKNDWKKTDNEKLEEEVKIEFDYAEALAKLAIDFEKAINDGDFDLVKEDALVDLEMLKTKAKEAADAADTLQAKLDLSEVIAKLDTSIKELDETAFNTFETMAQGMDRVMSSLMSIAEIFDEDIRDSELFKGMEAFMSVMNSSIQIMQTIASVSEMISKMEKKQAAEKVMNAGKEVLANEAVAASELKKAAAEGQEAAAGAASSVAGIPVAGPVLAVAAIGAVIAALLAGFSKFANGGIVGGNSFNGDKNVVRANSGEMILNRAQQGTLWNMLNGKGGVGSNVQFKIRGTDLIGVINNEQSKRRG